MESRSVLIVDDHPIVRRGLAQLINGEVDLHVVGEAEDVRGALEAIEQFGPDIAIVDIALGGGDGLELIKEIQRWHGDVRVLVLSMHDENLYAERAIRAGACGYVMKKEADQELLDALRRILRGGVHVSEAIEARLFKSLFTGQDDGVSDPIERLTNRELQVFRLIGEGRSTRQIAESLHLSIKTVESHREHIKEKLNLRTGTELVRQALRWYEASVKS